MLITKSQLRDLCSALGPYCTNYIVEPSGRFSQIRSHIHERGHIYERGPFPQKSDCELDLSAVSAKSVVLACENRLMLAHSIPKLQFFEYHTRAYLDFEISAFISVL